MSDEQILEELLALNLERAGSEALVAPTDAGEEGDEV